MWTQHLRFIGQETQTGASTAYSADRTTPEREGRAEGIVL